LSTTGRTKQPANGVDDSVHQWFHENVSVPPAFVTSSFVVCLLLVP
jgi:hypothetical protein